MVTEMKRDEEIKSRVTREWRLLARCRGDKSGKEATGCGHEIGKKVPGIEGKYL